MHACQYKIGCIPLWAVKRTPRSQCNDGYGADSGPYRPDTGAQTFVGAFQSLRALIWPVARRVRQP
jgi:hypothetical protein